MDTLLQVLSPIVAGLDLVIRQFGDMVVVFVKRLQNDASYREGFIVGMILAWIIGWVSLRIAFLRAQIIRYFSPTQVPATTPGPSPNQISAGCRLAWIKLIVWIAFILFVLYMVIRAISSVV